MNKLVVLARNSQTYFIKRLIEEVGHGRVCLINPWTDDQLPLGTERILFRSSGVYQSDLDLQMVRNSGLEVMNSLYSLEIFRSKNSQYQWFDSLNIACLKWTHLAQWESSTEGETFLLKPDFGQGGWGIEVFDKSSLLVKKEILKQKNDLSWIVQPFVTGEEYRVFFLGEKRITLKRRPGHHHFISNFNQKGEAIVATLPNHLKQIVEKLIFHSQAYYGAIDLFDLAEGPRILELNVVPGIEQLEALTGENIIRALLSAQFFCHIL